MINNNTKVWILILASCLSLLIIGYEFGHRTGLLVAFLISIMTSFFVFIYGEGRLLAKLGAQKVKGQDAWGLVNKVEGLSERLNIQTPSIYITPHTSINSFCVASSWRKNSIGFTAGLLQRFNEEELEAVIAHQLCHIRRLDTFAFGVSSTVANSIVGMGHFLDSFLSDNLQFFGALLSPIGWFIIKLATGQKTFLKNDLMAAKLLHSRNRLGEVLWRMEGLAQTIPMDIPPCSSHLFMVNPEGFKQKNIFLKSHPEIEGRLKNLMGYYPL